MISVKYNGREYTDAENGAPGLVSSGVPAEVVLEALHAQLSRSIDTAAGKARNAFVSPGELIEQEYQLAKREAKEWLDAGADESDVPTCVKDHADSFDVSVSEAANEIVTTGEAWEQAMRDIRTLRLKGKAAVRAADTIEGAEQAAQAAIAELNAIRPPEGTL
ncbi:MAG: hypothetical protein ACQEXI_00320 [Pseudomonadota bacterium]